MDESKLIAKIISKPKKALQRQIEEAVRILAEEPGNILNSKSGYGTNKIPRITITVGEDVKDRRADREEGEGNQYQTETQNVRVGDEDNGEECVWGAVGNSAGDGGVEKQPPWDGNGGGPRIMLETESLSTYIKRSSPQGSFGNDEKPVREGPLT